MDSSRSFTHMPSPTDGASKIPETSNNEDLVERTSLSLSSRSLHLADHITMEQFSSIMTDFHSKSSHFKSPRTTGMSIEVFKEAISKLLGVSPDDRKIQSLCNKIDMEGLGFIDANEFCSYILQKLREKDSLTWGFTLPFTEPPKFKHNTQSKETLCRLSLATNPLRYISVSKDGTVGTWNLKLQFQQGIKLDSSGGMEQGKTKTSVIVTDFAVMTNCNRIVLSTSSRELVFYDMSTRKFQCQYRLHDLPCVPLCMNYHSDQQSPGSRSFLLFGDVSGSVTVLIFLSPLTALFMGANKDKDKKPLLVGYGTLSEHAKLVTVQSISHLHSDWVSQVTYVPHNHTFLSCSIAPTNSLIARDIDHKTNKYIFKLRKGVMCFDFSHSLDMLVTGSLDHSVCVWNPYVPSKPVARMDGHNTTVLSVIIETQQNLIFSLSQDIVLCAWDVHEHVLIQTISIKFPFTQRLPDFGPGPLYLLPMAHSLAILCNEYVAELKVGEVGGTESEQESLIIMSHKHPLCAAVYNKNFHQVVSGCEGGVVSVWDMDNGSLVLRYSNCHGKEEITALNVDSTGRQIVTGSRAGDIKVWQYGSDTCTRHLKRDGYLEVTGVSHIQEREIFLSVGWDRKITTFHDDPNVYDIVPNESWKGEEVHQNDILCMAFCSPHYLATGSFDGEIKVWNTDLERMIAQFQSTSRSKPIIKKPRSRNSNRSTAADSSSPSLRSRSSLRSSSSRPASRRLTMHRIRSAVFSQSAVPIDQISFFPTRVQARNKGTASFVTSEGGMANFWDLFGSKKPIRSFPMTQYENENVLAMKIDIDEHYLLVGDTAGIISLFDVKDYPTADVEEREVVEPVVRWRAHSKEIMSVEFIPHESQQLVLSASGDGAVRLWTLKGHFIGTFGQEQPWDLKFPATFQHPSTPWRGEMWQSSLHHSGASSIKSSTSRMSTPSPSQIAKEKQMFQIPEVQEKQIQQGKVTMEISSSSGSSLASSKMADLTSSLADKSLGEPYEDHLQRRMEGRHKRRVHFSGVNAKATADKLGSVCSPFHALQLSKMEEIQIPPKMSLALSKVK